MSGKTHAVVGTSTALWILGSTNIIVLVGGVILALIGSLIPDIDLKKSIGGKITTRILTVITLIIIINSIIQKKFDTNMISNIASNSIIRGMIPSLVILLVLVVVGKISSHRGFTHSILSMLIYSIVIGSLVGRLSLWFTIGYATHLLIDLPNNKPIKLLYPIKRGICFGMCRADGKIDKLLRFTAIVFIAIKFLSLVGINIM